MGKICIVGDTHFARKAEHPILRKHISEGQDKFFIWLAEHLKSIGVDTVLFTGDLHDTRVSINVETLVKTKRMFTVTFNGFRKIVSLGNHD